MPGFIRGEEFKYGMIFVFGTEAGYCLAAVTIEYPHRYAVNPCNAGEKISKRFARIIIFDDELVIFAKVIFCHNANILPILEDLSI